MRTLSFILALLVSTVVARAQNDAVTGVERRVVDVKSSSGLTQKMIVTRPRNSSARLPAIVFVPWLNCDSLAIPDSNLHGAQIILKYLIERSALVVGRIEKPGVGGSEGECADTDFNTELAGYRAAFGRLASDEWVAPGGLIVAAQSCSGGIVPLVAQGRQVRGYFVMSGWVRTWLERLLEFERLRMIAAGTPLDVLAQRMRLYSEMYGIYLNQSITPAQVIAQRPHLAAVWEGPGTHQYGRTARFFQQLQALNLESEWSKVTAPTLVMWGDRDIAMHRSDHERIVDLVNANAPGSALLHIVSNGDHSLLASGHVPQDVFDAIDKWLGVVRR